MGEQGDKILETQEEARQRLLFDRVTMQAGKGRTRPVLYKVKVEDKPLKVDPKSIYPGKVPERLVGKKPKCFCIIEEFCGGNAHGVSVRAWAGVFVTHG